MAGLPCVAGGWAGWGDRRGIGRSRSPYLASNSAASRDSAARAANNEPTIASTSAARSTSACLRNRRNSLRQRKKALP